jgi:hypothetical protein
MPDLWTVRHRFYARMATAGGHSSPIRARTQHRSCGGTPRGIAAAPLTLQCAVGVVRMGHYHVPPTPSEERAVPTAVGGVKSMIFGGEGVFFARLRGPGHIWLQSLPFSRLAGRIMANMVGRRTDEGSVLGPIGDMLRGN